MLSALGFVLHFGIKQFPLLCIFRQTLAKCDCIRLSNAPDESLSFDAIYDKDSSGALDKHMRSAFCQRLAEYTKEGGIVYTEVKNKPEGPGREHGPPFHVESEDLMEEKNFGSAFEYVASLGQVYELVGMPPGMSQMGHVLKRVAK